MQISLEVLENYIPAFFRNAKRVYNEMKEEHVNKNKVRLYTFQVFTFNINNILLKHFQLNLL